MLKLLLAAAIALHLQFSPGGSVLEFIAKYDAVEATGGSLYIDGGCISACTLFTGLVAPERVCITPRAFLGFHSASAGGEYSEDGTQLLWNIYPIEIQEFLKAKGWDGTTAHPALIFMTNSEMRKIYRACGGPL